MTDDLISRQAAIDALIAEGRNVDSRYLESERIIHESDAVEAISLLSPAQQEQQWIPIKTRPMTEEERQYYSEMYGYDIEYEEAVMFDCKMPEDGQEVWVCSKCGNVWQDTCVVDEGIGLEGNGDWLDIVAWMPFEKPKPWKGE